MIFPKTSLNDLTSFANYNTFSTKSQSHSSFLMIFRFIIQIKKEGDGTRRLPPLQ